MSRPLRIEYCHAWYHVMNRGRRGENVFLEKADYSRFKTLLAESLKLWKVNICGYCLMPNHYHLLIQTPEANLSRFMRHLNGIYTQGFNRYHHLDGQLFRGRFKSILVGEADYLVALLQYIHFNPVKAGLSKRPEDYVWSSHSSYITSTKPDEWLNTDLVFEQFQGKQITGNKRANLLKCDASVEIYEFFNQTNVLSVLGTANFVDRIRNRYFRSIVHPEVPDMKGLSIESSVIIDTVSNYLEVPRTELFIHQRARKNTPRDIAMYLTRMKTSKTLREIAEIFQMDKYNSVSNCINRIKKRILEDEQMKATINAIETRLDSE